MNKKMKVSLRKSQAFCLALLCTSSIFWNAYAKNDMAYRVEGVPSTSYTLDVDRTLSLSTGIIYNEMPFSSGEIAEVSFYFNWEPGVSYRNKAYIGSAGYAGDFALDSVDKNTTITYNGHRYYKIKEQKINSKFPFYVSITQEISDSPVYGKVANDVPYNTDNNAGSELNDKCPLIPFTGPPKDPYFVSCINGNKDILVKVLRMTSGRNGTIRFYAPKVPTESIIFNNVLISTTRLALGISDSSYADADSRTKEVLSTPSGGFEILNFFINGELRFDNSCQISGPVVVEVPLGSLATSAFTTKGGKPSGYTPKETKLTFTCKRGIPDTYGGMAWSISPTATSTGSGLDGVLVAKPTGSNTVTGVGVKVTSDPGGNTAIKLGGDSLQKATINDTIATATFYSYPTMTTDQKPTGGGDFEATATVMFEVP